MNDNLLELDETSRRLLVCNRTVSTLIKAGEIKCVRVGRQVRVAESELKKFIARGGCRKRQKNANSKEAV